MSSVAPESAQHSGELGTMVAMWAEFDLMAVVASDVRSVVRRRAETRLAETRARRLARLRARRRAALLGTMWVAGSAGATVG